MRVAVIGLGRMGGPIADHIIRAGHDVRVFDVDPTRCEPRVALGAVACSSAGEAARGAELISIIVFDDEQLLEVLLAEDGIINTMERGAVIAVHTTVTRTTVRDVVVAGSVRDAPVLDAGISGGEAGAQAGTLLLLVGGEAEVIDHVRPVLDTFAKEIVHAGPWGTGMALKLARNSIGYGWMSVVADAMAMAEAAGVDPALVRHAVEQTDAITGGPGAILIRPTAGEMAGDDPLRPYLAHAEMLGRKDLELAIAAGDELGVPTLMAEQALGLLGAALGVAAPPTEG